MKTNKSKNKKDQSIYQPQLQEEIKTDILITEQKNKLTKEESLLVLAADQDNLEELMVTFQKEKSLNFT